MGGWLVGAALPHEPVEWTTDPDRRVVHRALNAHVAAKAADLGRREHGHPGPQRAPGTGTPEVGGPTSFFGLETVRRLHGLNFVGFDVVEVLPAHDAAQVTQLLAATLAFEFVALAALKKERGAGTGCGAAHRPPPPCSAIADALPN